jgi:hypothetical protein
LFLGASRVLLQIVAGLVVLLLLQIDQGERE